MDLRFLLILISSPILFLGQTENSLESFRIIFPAASTSATPVQTENIAKQVETPRFKLNNDKEVAYIIDTITKNNIKIRKARGYRVSVYNGTDKDEAKRAKEYIYELYPNINIISEYKQPDYRIKMGDFTERYEAFEALGKIALKYPDALIVPEIVDINPPKSNE